MTAGHRGSTVTDLEKRFAAAQKAAKILRDKPDNETLLELYSYFKQATEGDVTGARPSAFDFVARAKYDAWAARKGMGRDVAMRGYAKLVEHLQALED
jgi:carboxylesterase